MDCEKFEDALMDELYGELDEVTSAALRRHASGCARCAERLASLRATRRVVASSAFAQVAPPVDLEARIFAAAHEARKVVPIRSRMTRFVSIAGRWAMRPQTASISSRLRTSWSGTPSEAAIGQLPVATARQPGRAATVRALATSQTLTRTRMAGTAWSRRSSAACGRPRSSSSPACAGRWTTVA